MPERQVISGEQAVPSRLDSLHEAATAIFYTTAGVLGAAVGVNYAIEGRFLMATGSFCTGLVAAEETLSPQPLSSFLMGLLPRSSQTAPRTRTFTVVPPHEQLTLFARRSAVYDWHTEGVFPHIRAQRVTRRQQ